MRARRLSILTGCCSGLIAACAILALAAGDNEPRDGSPFRVEFRATQETDNGIHVSVTGLDSAALERLTAATLDREAWTHILSVSVAPNRVEHGSDPDAASVRVTPAATEHDRPQAMLGEYRIENGGIIFEPRFPLKPGLSYQAVFNPGALPGSSGKGRPITAEFSLPKPKQGEPTTVAAVYPTRATLPENQLKFYLHFSAPMSRGEAYERVKLLGPDGKRVEYPFLELGEELWDPAHTRFTLFFDPGRIKRGLQPRELFGPALVEGKSYTLVVEKGWPDAAGNPLRESFTKKFNVTAPDDTQPDPSRWKIAAPAAGTRDPLTITFDEPLDHGMLGRVLIVTDPSAQPVAGRIEVDREETRWRFRPERQWSSGRHAVAVETTLEDLAGNSIGRPFEVDVVRPIEKRIERRSVSLPFDVRERATR